MSECMDHLCSFVVFYSLFVHFMCVRISGVNSHDENILKLHVMLNCNCLLFKLV